ncbi:hypothetical protein PEL8287_01114 [Roseovarius litorisediminis]|uniref:Rod shape-determining protein MreD n=1 Tax=Roseovarius litorisediminis TaxID=1312363 RepID=A0A1Y5RU03_9RHOB|nr:rod shape-determining protein MreD [Roseovarius litorisediminis]SLN24372.1 hypothetical protein PEL8287_01114 [Roseovarius litorisediminis]
MAERSGQHFWIMRSFYLLLCLIVVFMHLLPVNTVPRGWAGPDLVLALTFAWVVRRPEFVPPLLVALVFVLTDLLFQRPPGLWAALVLLGSETLRARAPGLRELAFPVEWLTVTTTLIAMTLAFRLILAILLVDQAPLWLSAMQLVMTLLAYPLVVWLSHAILGVRKLAPGDLDAHGRRL